MNKNASASWPVKVILDTDMLTDFDDVGALACLHALADAGECEIIATISSTGGNASVGTVEIINRYCGRPDVPVGSPKGMGVIGGAATAKVKVDPTTPPGRNPAEANHDKYRWLLEDYPGWYKYADADDAPDANDVYRRVLAAQPDHSVAICSIGFLTNMRRLLETGPDEHSPLDGRALVAQKVIKRVAMACWYPRGKEYNSMMDWESSKIALENWPTPIIFSDFQYGCDIYSGRAVAEMEGPRNPIKDVFAGHLPSREAITQDPEGWNRRQFGMGGRSSWDQTTVLACVRGEESYFGVERGTHRMIGTEGENEWIPSADGPHLRLVDKTPKAEVGRLIDGLICACVETHQRVAQEGPIRNPLFGRHRADPQIRRFGDACWIYPTGCSRGQGFDAYSSQDLKTWTCHPGALKMEDISWARACMWAPDVQEHDGKYYFFFSANDAYPVDLEHGDLTPHSEPGPQKYGGIGVAVAGRPEGPYRDWIGRPLIDQFWNRAQPIDQYVFQYDGGWYMVYGGWRRCNLVRLAPDFKSLLPLDDGALYREVTPHDYVEAPVMFERNGIWYFMYSAGSWTDDSYRVNYSVGKTPIGPFTFKGTVLASQPPIATGPGHHSVLNLPGTDEWYICYHRRPIPNPRALRVTCLDRMDFDDNGDILPVVMTTGFETRSEGSGSRGSGRAKRPCRAAPARPRPRRI